MEEEEHRRLLEEAGKAKDKAKQELKGDPTIVAKKTISAREKIDAISSPDELRKILDQVIDLGYEFVIDKILGSNYLSE